MIPMAIPYFGGITISVFTYISCPSSIELVGRAKINKQELCEKVTLHYLFLLVLCEYFPTHVGMRFVFGKAAENNPELKQYSTNT